MKNLILILIFLLSFQVYSQDEYNTYYNSYVKESYSISVGSEKPNNYYIYIRMMSMESKSDEGGINFTHIEHADFIQTMKDAKSKYNEWSATAKQNSVDKLSKTMSYTFKTGGYFQYGSKWHFQKVVVLTFDFMIIDTKHLLVIRTNELQSMTNEYIKHDGFTFVFQSSKEISDFINLISIENIQSFLNKPKTSDLFKE
jgi:hypothetical protein